MFYEKEHAKPIPIKQCLSKVTFASFVKHQLKIIQRSFSLRVSLLVTLTLQCLMSMLIVNVSVY